MNLDEMADFVCGKVNQLEAEDITACKGYLKRRLKLIWDDGLWKDSLVEFVQTLSMSGYTVSSNWLPSQGILIVPKDIDCVVAVRTDMRALNVRRPEFYYRRDYDAFGLNGEAIDFMLLPPCVWQFDGAARDTTITFGVVADATGTDFTYEILSSNGVDLDRTAVTSSGSAIDLAATTLIAALQKTATAGSILLTEDSGPTLLLTLLPSDTAAPKRQRIKLVQVPAATAADFTIRLLGKRALPSMEGDLESPAIRGSENCLIAFAQADMLERDEQYGKAQAKLQEALVLLQQLKAVETVQQAHNVSITPAGGYGDDYDYRAGAFSNW